MSEEVVKRIFFEQYRDANNREPFGWILRWTIDSCVEVDMFEITSASAELGKDGWWQNPDIRNGSENMEPKLNSDQVPQCEFDTLAPMYRLWMKYDGTVHLWQSDYYPVGSAEGIFSATDMLRYVAARAAQYIQERLTMSSGMHKVFPLNHNQPQIEVKPFEPEKW